MSGFAVPVFTWFYQGQVAAGGSVNVYLTGTTTFATIYSDGALTTPLPNPLTLDSNGQCKFYVAGTTNLRMDGYTFAGAFIESIDPIFIVGNAQNLSAGFLTTEATIASATTTDLGSITTTNIISITGTNTINSFGSGANTNNPLYFIRFTGALTLTYNATSMILPSAANLTVNAGDAAIVKYEGTGNWRMVNYMPLFGQIPGTATNDSAGAGKLGEFITNSGSNISLSNGVATNICTISLTPGDWDVWGAIQHSPAVSTTVTITSASISTISATLGAFGTGALNRRASSYTAAGTSMLVGTVRLQLATTTTVYLIADATFGVSTMTASGNIYARRAR